MSVYDVLRRNLMFILSFQSTIVDHLGSRYEKDIIYTYIGDILLAVNPFKKLPIYTEEVCW